MLTEEQFQADIADKIEQGLLRIGQQIHAIAVIPMFGGDPAGYMGGSTDYDDAQRMVREMPKPPFGWKLDVRTFGIYEA